MCRIIAYLGHEVLLEDILVKPKNSLLAQSLHAREMALTTNGDGFGLAWFMPQISAEPGLFTSIFPAWNDRNLKHLAAKLSSPCFLAHIRAASQGTVSNVNCHPFVYQDLACIHNGGIGHFMKVKRHLRSLLDDDLYNWIQGETDSEHFFALFLQNLKSVQTREQQALVNTFQQTLKQVLELVDGYGDSETSFLNVCISDGKFLMASRISSHPDKPARTLHYSLGDKFVSKDGVCHMHADKEGKNEVVVIASEELNDFETEWHTVPENSIIFVGEEKKVQLYNF